MGRAVEFTAVPDDVVICEGRVEGGECLGVGDWGGAPSKVWETMLVHASGKYRW